MLSDDGKHIRHTEALLDYAPVTAERPARYEYEPPRGTIRPRATGQGDRRRVPIRDVRPHAAELSLDRQGFILQRQRSDVSNFYDKLEVKTLYVPEIERLLSAVTGASRIVVFNTTIRCARFVVPNRFGITLPSMHVHNDYTEKSGPRRVRDQLPIAEAETLLKGRFAIINVWRPIVGPVLASPLAVCDGSTVSPEDLVATDLRYADRVGEIYSLNFNPRHDWYYVPGMNTDEVLIFKCFDSAKDGRTRFTPHSAFEDAGSPSDAPARESIEVRSLVFFPSARET